MKLQKLSPEQEKLLPLFRERAIKVALYGGDEIDVEKFHAGTKFIYSLAKLDDPIKIHVDSPVGVQYACHLLKNMKLAGDQIRAQVGDQVRAQVWDQVGDQVWAQVRARGLTYERPAYIGLGYDSGWVAFYNVFAEIVILEHDLFAQYSEFMNSGIWDMVLFNGCAIACRRPNKVCRDDQNRLHNDNGSAISWRDGFELFYLDGINIQPDLFKQITSHQMTLDELVAIQDTDVRAVALKYNKNAIINSRAELLDSHPTAGELFLIEKQTINELLDEPKLYFLRMQCPTGRVFVEAVDPKFASKHPYSLNCQANAFGIDPKIYEQVVNHG